MLKKVGRYPICHGKELFVCLFVYLQHFELEHPLQCSRSGPILSSRTELSPMNMDTSSSSTRPARTLYITPNSDPSLAYVLLLNMIGKHLLPEGRVSRCSSGVIQNLSAKLAHSQTYPTSKNKFPKPVFPQSNKEVTDKNRPKTLGK